MSTEFQYPEELIQAELPPYEAPPPWIPPEHVSEVGRPVGVELVFQGGFPFEFDEGSQGIIMPNEVKKSCDERRRGNPYYDNDLVKFLPRTVNLRRNRNNDALGFNIRGGQEHSCGIFISKVLPNTDAQRLGLQEGDKILSANDIPFDNTEHAQAVRILKQNTDVQLIVQYFPYGYQKTYEKTRALKAQQSSR